MIPLLIPPCVLNCHLMSSSTVIHPTPRRHEEVRMQEELRRQEEMRMQDDLMRRQHEELMRRRQHEVSFSILRDIVGSYSK